MSFAISVRLLFMFILFIYFVNRDADDIAFEIQKRSSGARA